MRREGGRRPAAAKQNGPLAPRDGGVAQVRQSCIEGSPFLDGHTGDGTVGLAPSTEAPFTGTRWRIEVPFGDDNQTVPADG